MRMYTCASYKVCIATMSLMYLYNMIHKGVPFQVYIAYQPRIVNMNSQVIGFLIIRIKLIEKWPTPLLFTCVILRRLKNHPDVFFHDILTSSKFSEVCSKIKSWVLSRNNISTFRT